MSTYVYESTRHMKSWPNLADGRKASVTLHSAQKKVFVGTTNDAKRKRPLHGAFV